MFTAIHSSSVALSSYLRSQLERLPAPGLGFGGAGARVVSLSSPRQMREAMQEGLSVWLYHVQADAPQHRNLPELDTLSTLIAQTPPLALRLHYLVTPVVLNDANGESPGVEQQVLGRALQALHAKPVLSGADLMSTGFADTPTALLVRLESLSVDELARVWEGLGGAFQPAVSYEISVVQIDAAGEL